MLIRSSIADLRAGDIALLGVPLDENSSFLRGPKGAPDLIVQALESDSANYFTESLVDLDEHPKVKWIDNVPFDSYLDIQTPISNVLDKGAIPFALGGDHSVTFPILQAMGKKYDQLSILHFDAHGDLYDELDGNRHSHACPFARIMESGLAQNLTQVGIRTMTAHQRIQAERFDVEVITMRDWNDDIRFDLDGPVYLSFDMDVLDPAFAPGVSHHEPGGFSTREVLRMIQGLELNIVGADVVEYNPERDLNSVTSMVAAKVVKEIIDQIL